MQADLSTSRLSDPDGFYAALVAAHEGLGDGDSALLNARLVMLLANQVGDAATLQACIDAAAAPLRNPRPA
ncbi:DUF2783 domain-containing protein [Ramlibacter sp. MAHUQ-53]|uniref:DUF2783 domain-containing protein n=1 Tax=unclassified Ramlibacter TaxID=2617605 RepID=UPI003631902D